jgi:phenylacetate-CoA ligase
MSLSTTLNWPTLYGKLMRHVIYPASEGLRGLDTLACLQRLERSQYWPPEKMADYQLCCIQRLVSHAYGHVPFYREGFRQAGIRPEDIRSLEDFAAMPLLEKDELRKDPQRFIADNAGRLAEVRTGGSAGMPMLFFAGRDNTAASKANVLRAWRWWGVEIGEPWVRFWGHGASFAPGWRGHWARWTRPLRNRLYNYRTFSAYDMSPERMGAYWRYIKQVRPRLLLGYASTLYVFARFLKERNYDAHLPGLKVVVSTSEQLYDWQREQITRVFGCPVANEYGATEVGIIAYECPAGRLHLSDEAIHAEMLPLSQSGETNLGEIIITQLSNWGAPLIRYRTGDLAEGISQGCPCGSSLKVLEGLGGRVQDLFLAPDGRYVHGLFFTHILEYVPGVKRFQIIQESLDHMRVRIVPDSSQPVDEGFVSKRIRQHLGSQVSISFEYTDDIPLERSGKYRWVVSKLRGQVPGKNH